MLVACMSSKVSTVRPVDGTLAEFAGYWVSRPSRHAEVGQKFQILCVLLYSLPRLL